MSSDKVVIVTDSEFDSTVLQSERPVVLDFWAEWCQPCKMLAPTMEEIAGEYEDKIKVGKLNVDVGVQMDRIHTRGSEISERV